MKIAACIVRSRERSPLLTTSQLVAAVAPCTPKRDESKFLTKLFQALRIEVNEQDPLAQYAERCGDIDRGRGFSHSALLVCNSYNLSHFYLQNLISFFLYIISHYATKNNILLKEYCFLFHVKHSILFFNDFIFVIKIKIRTGIIRRA